MKDENTSQQSIPQGARIAWLVTWLIFTPISLAATIGSTGAGHGDYVLAFALYPVPVMMIMGGDMLIPGIVFAIAQFPVWGIAGFLAKTRRAFWITAGVLLGVHIMMAICVFVHG